MKKTITKTTFYILLFLLFIANASLAQWKMPASDRLMDDGFPFNAFKFKGKVKAMKIRFKDFHASNTSAEHGIKLDAYFDGSEDYYYKVSYQKEGGINTWDTYDTANRLISKLMFVYDQQNKIIEKYESRKDGVLKKIIAYTYVSLGRWNETIYYDSLAQIDHRDEKVYNNNKLTVTYLKGTPSESKTTYQYDKDKTVLKTYLPNGMLYYKSKEITTGKIKTTSSEHYNNGRKWGITIIIQTDTETFFKTTESQQNPVTTTEVSKKNEYCDVFQMKTSRSGFPEHINGETIETIEYVYDKEGNFVSKTHYFNGTPTYQTIREIEYY